ncbi:MAG: BadF/BadG/BcrA/BcrD ATPase family protein [Nitriliruptoraceae bacterium]
MTGTYLGIDAGKTGTRAVVVDDGRCLGTTTGPGFENIAAVGARDRIHEALQHTLSELPGVRDGYDGTCLGLTGVLTPGAYSARILDLLLDLVPTRRAVVTSDVVTSYCGALGLRPGAVVAAGTGSITLAVGPDGTLSRVDGWGYLLDDGGSAFEIGRAGLRSALRASDGRGGSAALLLAALARYGDTESITDAIYGADNPPSVVAGFARVVSEVAEAEDPTALTLLQDAGVALASSVAAAARRAFGTRRPIPVSYCGGVFRAGPLVTDAFLRALADELQDARPEPPAGDALDGAVLLAATTQPTVVDDMLLVADQVAL